MEKMLSGADSLEHQYLTFVLGFVVDQVMQNPTKALRALFLAAFVRDYPFQIVIIERRQQSTGLSAYSLDFL